MESKESVIANNELIANFMGYKGQHEDWCGNNILEMDEMLGEEDLRPYKPNESWNDLMPVVEKISTIHYGWDKLQNPFDDCAYPRTFGMLNAEGKPMVRINASTLHTADTLIEATFLAVVDFIEWYNEQQILKK